ncbi:PilZ domain-containing protein [Kaarinaea lacus]
MSNVESISPGGVMENRWSDRRELQLDVEVFRDGTKVCSCQSRDVGLGGAFLDLDSSHSLGEDENIELVFHLVTSQSPIKHNLHAKVVRITEEGVGLKFHDFDTGVFRSLQEIMSYKSPGKTQQ